MLKSFKLYCIKCHSTISLLSFPPCWTRNGFFSLPYFKCKNCGQLYRQHINWRKAIVYWPLCVACLLLIIYIKRIWNINPRYSPLAGIIGGSIGGLISGVILRQTVDLLPADDRLAFAAKNELGVRKAWLFPLFAMILIIFSLLGVGANAYHRILAIVICISIWSIWYWLFID